MRQLFIILLLSISSFSYSQTIDGFCNLKFGAKQDNVLNLSWVKNSIVNQESGENNLDLFVENVKYNNTVYELCLCQFYKKKLYGGAMVKSYDSKDSMLQAIDSIKNTIKLKPSDIRYNTNLSDGKEIDRLLFTDSNQNQLILEALEQNGSYTLRLKYGSVKSYEKKEKEEHKRLKKE